LSTSTAEGGGSALLYASNTFAANKAGYKLDPLDLAVVVALRHFSTPFGYTDAIWAKYGAAFSEIARFKDPKTKAAPTTNLYNSADCGLQLTNFGNTIPNLVQKNVQFAICNVATRFFAGAIAERTKGNADAIYSELAANLILNSHLAAAGVVAVNVLRSTATASCMRVKPLTMTVIPASRGDRRDLNVGRSHCVPMVKDDAIYRFVMTISRYSLGTTIVPSPALSMRARRA
jgi:hypothetical protein